MTYGAHPVILSKTVSMIESQRIKHIALDVGFSLCGIASAMPIKSQLPYLLLYLAQGKNASMGWIARDPDRRIDPSSLLDNARSVICCALSYGKLGIDGGPNENKAAFARGKDYHVVIMKMLKRMVAKIKEDNPNNKFKCCVDTSPILEKALASRAGLGWIGKNTLLINQKFGPWLLLGEIVTDLEIAPDSPVENRCGDCERCVKSCPTSALDGLSLDATRCISYLTIEHRGEISEGLKSKVRPNQYGCDLCIEACPYKSVRY